MRLKLVGAVAVVALVCLAAYTYRTREASPYCLNQMRVAPEASCHTYTYWWDR